MPKEDYISATDRKRARPILRGSGQIEGRNVDDLVFDCGATRTIVNEECSSSMENWKDHVESFSGQTAELELARISRWMCEGLMCLSLCNRDCDMMPS